MSFGKDLEEDIKKIGKEVENLKWRPLSKDRSGLYIMVAIAMVAGVKSCNRTQKILDNYQNTPQMQVQNVIGQEAPEKFYDFQGKRVYLEVDGKSVEQYFPIAEEEQ